MAGHVIDGPIPVIIYMVTEPTHGAGIRDPAVVECWIESQGALVLAEYCGTEVKILRSLLASSYDILDLRQSRSRRGPPCT